MNNKLATHRGLFHSLMIYPLYKWFEYISKTDFSVQILIIFFSFIGIVFNLNSKQMVYEINENQTSHTNNRFFDILLISILMFALLSILQSSLHIILLIVSIAPIIHLPRNCMSKTTDEAVISLPVNTSKYVFSEFIHPASILFALLLYTDNELLFWIYIKNYIICYGLLIIYLSIRYFNLNNKNRL